MGSDSRIDPTARVHEDARLAEDVEVGAYSVIGADVEIGSGTRVGPHAVVHGPTRIGRDNRIFQFVSLGEDPQHRGYQGEPTRLEIGDRNSFREFCSVHRGTTLDEGVTRIGDDNLLMAYCHIAHDCVLGNGVTMANGASLAGHVRVGDHCILGGFALVYQFVHVGTLAFLGYGSGVSHSVPAFVRCSGYPAKPHGINSVGMRRHGYDDSDVTAMKHAYRVLYRSKLRLEEAKARLADDAAGNAAVKEFLASLEASERGVIR
ncbi:UDP-N-acetylglucosamine acyltransferase [Salinisphaera sp. PC39]|uniref:acyl-ACP--UDP-N-acetylglucosamine O-acyltransferase n=1 Tax=Salinisphaera sp. PC39 TaxID=1304156 RepID=UPI0033419540